MIQRVDFNFEQIPNEIIFQIFEYLTPKDLFHIFLVSQRFGEFANDEYIW